MNIRIEESYRLTTTPEAAARLERLVRQSRAVTFPAGLRNAAEARAALLALARRAKEDAVDAEDIASAEARIGRIEEASDAELLLACVGRGFPKRVMGTQRPEHGGTR